MRVVFELYCVSNTIFFPSPPSNISALNFVKRDKLFLEGVPHEDNKNTTCKQSNLEMFSGKQMSNIKY